MQIDGGAAFTGDHQVAIPRSGQLRAKISAHIGITEIAAFGRFSGDV